MYEQLRCPRWNTTDIESGADTLLAPLCEPLYFRKGSTSSLVSSLILCLSEPNQLTTGHNMIHICICISLPRYLTVSTEYGLEDGLYHDLYPSSLHSVR